MAAISIFDIFKIGIGPSSSHTVGPMKAALAFASRVAKDGLRLNRVQVELYGSLAHTGRGHGTDSAIILGLCGYRPESVEPAQVRDLVESTRKAKQLLLAGTGDICFDPDSDIVFHYEQTLPRHTNGMRFLALDRLNRTIFSEDYFSLGGGFIVRNDDEEELSLEDPPLPFSNAASLLSLADEHGLTIAQLMLINERHWRSDQEIQAGVDEIWAVMRSCVSRGLSTEGILPGRIGVPRRAPGLYSALMNTADIGDTDRMDWISAYAIAVNEENAAGGRVVTSPTNGAAGIIPAVLHYYHDFVPNAAHDGVVRFLLTAAAIGILYKINASISGAEMGCQGEVGVACSMAAAGLVAALGGSNLQIENGAEIGMEHNLGLTCDPVGGLVQIPCIERNAMGAVKAVNAARLALRGNGLHKVSLDQVIRTMRQTGIDMSTIYKETARGGLAVNVPEC